MAYEPTTWATGDIITADKLNNIETGVEDADLEVGELAARPTVTSVQITASKGGNYLLCVAGENLPNTFVSGALPAGTATLEGTDISAACHQQSSDGTKLVIDLSAIAGFTGKLDQDKIATGSLLVFTVGGVSSAPYGLPGIPIVTQPAADGGTGGGSDSSSDSGSDSASDSGSDSGSDSTSESSSESDAGSESGSETAS